MANEIAKNLAEITLIPNAVTAIYTLGVGKRAIVTSMHLHNTSGSTVTITLYRAPSGSAAGVANQIYKIELAANESWQWEGLRVLNTATDTIEAIASTTSVVTIEIDGVEEDA